MNHFIYHRRVAYHETDAMAVVHHTNHVKYFEEARVAWLREKQFIKKDEPYGQVTFAVIKLANRYFKPVIFDDELQIWTQVRVLSPIRVEFQYAVYCPRLNEIAADGRTELVPLSKEFRPSRMPDWLIEACKVEPWSEIWPPVVDKST